MFLSSPNRRTFYFPELEYLNFGEGKWPKNCAQMGGPNAHSTGKTLKRLPRLILHEFVGGRPIREPVSESSLVIGQPATN